MTRPHPAIHLAHAGWLVGAWEWEGLGGWSEEVWSTPAGGSMMGVFPPVRSDANTLWFDGLTLRRNDDDTMDARVAFESGGEGAFHYRRATTQRHP